MLIEVRQDLPLLVFGGPYSNLAATLAIREKAVELKIPNSNVICTGDIVAYCASPRECTDLIHDWGIHVVQGNCEDALGNDKFDCGCGFKENSSCDLASKQWYEYSKARIGEDQKVWMADLPNNLKINYHGKTIIVIHGGVNQQSQFIFRSSSTTDKLQQLKQTDSDIIISGHCGLPFGELIEDKAWLNAGVIGMPANDATTDVWYMLITPNAEGLEVSWHRLSYDFKNTQALMQSAGLNQGYINALGNGLWPSLDVLPETEIKKTGEKLSIATELISNKP